MFGVVFIGHFIVGIIVASIGAYRSKDYRNKAHSTYIDTALIVFLMGYVSLVLFVYLEWKETRRND